MSIPNAFSIVFCYHKTYRSNTFPRHSTGNRFRIVPAILFQAARASLQVLLSLHALCRYCDRCENICLFHHQGIIVNKFSIRPCSFPDCPNLADGRYREAHAEWAKKEQGSYDRCDLIRQDGWATSLEYSTNPKRVILKHNFTEYDQKAMGMPAPDGLFLVRDSV